MKYLSNYMEDEQTKTFNFAGAFFAFSDEQFEEKKVKGIKYVSAGGGLMCPKKNLEWLRTKLNFVYKAGIKKDMLENGKCAIIEREINNYETRYTGDATDVLDALKDYPIEKAEIIEMI